MKFIHKLAKHSGGFGIGGDSVWLHQKSTIKDIAHSRNDGVSSETGNHSKNTNKKSIFQDKIKKPRVAVVEPEDVDLL